MEPSEVLFWVSAVVLLLFFAGISLILNSRMIESFMLEDRYMQSLPAAMIAYIMPITGKRATQCFRWKANVTNRNLLQLNCFIFFKIYTWFLWSKFTPIVNLSCLCVLEHCPMIHWMLRNRRLKRAGFGRGTTSQLTGRWRNLPRCTTISNRNSKCWPWDSE